MTSDLTPPNSVAPAAPSYKETLNLPKTSFDMKANLIQREPALLKQWQEQNLYQQIRETRKSSPKGKWVLHDGPPYANGDIHMGHVINKVLKDIVIKFRTMQGYDSPYIPGWDCHGLPIESAIQKELGPKFRELEKSEVRTKCHDYAMKYVKLQGEGFQRLGVFGDFSNPYLTLDKRYEAGTLDVLAELVQRDLVYRQKKPVHWCTFDRTALAEAELEYADKKDSSIYVTFKINSVNEGKSWDSLLVKADKAFEVVRPGVSHIVTYGLMIWTTTPWTLPANRAVAINPNNEYVFARYLDNQGRWNQVIVAAELVERIGRLKPESDFYVADLRMLGKDLAALGIRYYHPLGGPFCPVVLADYVTLEDGTGLVHTAPGHGTEDYQTGRRENLETYCPVLPDGRYDDTVPEFLRADPKTTIWTANQLVIEKLKENGTLFHTNEFTHSYPHCWRCKKPVIFRATEQWFVKASSGENTSTKSSGSGAMPSGAGAPVGMPVRTPGSQKPASPLWTTAKQYVNQTQWIPAWGKHRIDGMLDTRPDWCISRQRSWGVPIPAFFDPQGKVLLTEKTVRQVAAHFLKVGADSWYTQTPAQILGTSAWTENGITWDTTTLDKGQDILDVWFESGASHHAVLECTHPELGYPADMYLEGSDQHRGWFQSSLLEASGYKSQPPFKQVLTHGFVVDGQGHKMSKSEGNDIKVVDALKTNGADVLRLWVSSVDYQNDIPCSKDLFARTSEAYRKIRNTIRYLLGNLYDFNPHTDAVAPHPHSIDSWMQAKVDAMATEVYRAYDEYEFHKVFKTIYEFCNVEISAIYAKAIKDRLYCELPTAAKRRASQTVCWNALLRLVELTAPILVYTADEAWTAVRALPGCAKLEPSIHLHELATLPPTAIVPAHWATLMPLIESGNKQLDELKRAVGLGNPLDAEAVIILPKTKDDLTALIAQYGPEIEDALGVGYHRIEQGDGDGGGWDIKILDTREKYPSCARSWKRRPDVGSNPAYPDLSARDAEVVAALKK